MRCTRQIPGISWNAKFSGQEFEKLGKENQEFTFARQANTENGNKILFDFTDAFWITIYSNDITEGDTVNDIVKLRYEQIINLIKQNKNITILKSKKIIQTTLAIIETISK